MDQEKRGGGIILALASATGFSTLGLFAKLIYAEGFSVPQALSWRFLAASLLLWSIVVATKRGLPRRILPILLLGLFGFAPQAGLYFVTVRILDPGITSLLLYLYPSFVVLFGYILYRKKPSSLQLLALGLSLAGCVLTFWKRGDYPLGGLLLGVVVGISYGAYLSAGERILAEADSIAATALIMSVAAVVYWVIALIAGPLRVPTTGRGVFGVLGVSAFATVLPITTLFASMRRIGAADASLVSTLEPVLTLGLSALIIGERLGPAQLAGGALILAAVLLLDLGPRLRSLRKRRAGRDAGGRSER